MQPAFVLVRPQMGENIGAAARGMWNFGLDHMRVVAPRDPSVGEEPLIDFSSGYILRALDELPRQGDREPWKLRQNYLRDRRSVNHDPIDDGVLTFR